jgi:hypothetical protein
MNQSIIFMFAAIIIVGAMLFGIIGLTKQGKKYLNVDHYRIKWLDIERRLKSDEPSSFKLCVMDADNLVDKALKERGFRGQTMGERLKSAASSLSNRNAVWTAHKLRNQIAHEDIRISYDESRMALGGFKQALKDLGAI